ncbi:MAG: M48 family metallopeptidase [Deltaproteobacteria bacterium]|nr:M48 family metallopeptidase [Deltaproteobacteria bacterium]
MAAWPDTPGPVDFRERQARNRRLSAWIVFCFLLLFVAVGLSADYVYLDAFTPAGPPFPVATVASLALAAAITLTSYYQGSALILRSLGAEPLDLQIPEHREVHNVVTEMALASGCPMPRIHVIFDPAPNAFATGRDEFHASVCVTTGLLALLNREETQGVIAHEIAHVRNQDILLMTLVSILLGGIALLSDWTQRSFSASRPRRGTSSKSAALVVPALLLIVLSPLISRLLAMAVSRQREYLADATGAEYTRNPMGLAKALEKIRDAAMPFSHPSRGTAHLFFVNPLRRRVDDREGRLADLLSTHPPIARRMLLLYRMAGVHGQLRNP